MRFTTSDRRRFERDVYDFGRSLGLSKGQTMKELYKARVFCGEGDYDSDNSAWEDEVDDSLVILDKLSNLVVSTSTNVELLMPLGVKAPRESVCILEEQNASSFPNLTQGLEEENQEKPIFDLKKIATGIENTVPKSSSVGVNWAELVKSRKRKSAGTEVVLVDEDRHVEKKTRQQVMTRIGTQYENTTQTVQYQYLRGQNPQDDNCEKAEIFQIGGNAEGNKVTLCRQSKQSSIENEEIRDASHQGFSSPMIQLARPLLVRRCL